VQLAAAALLIELSRADFKQSPEEQQAIEKALQKKFEFSQQEIATLVELADLENQQSTSLYEFTLLINENYNQEQKFALLKTLWEVAIADGEISKYEDHLIRKIADLIYAPHSDFIKSKLAVLGQNN
jgi:uncharacterized tellurite resistance protein B-like protein